MELSGARLYETITATNLFALLIRVSNRFKYGSGSGLAPAQNILAVQVWFGFT